MAAPVFKTGGAALDAAWWVQLPCAPANPLGIAGDPDPRAGPGPMTHHRSAHEQPLVVHWTARWGDFMTWRGLQVLVPVVVGLVLLLPWLLSLAGVALVDSGTVTITLGLGVVLLLFGVLVTARFLRLVWRSVGATFTWTVTGRGVHVQNDRGRDSRYPWATIRSATDRGATIEVAIQKGPRLHIPKRAWADAAATQDFLDRLQRHVTEVAETPTAPAAR